MIELRNMRGVVLAGIFPSTYRLRFLSRPDALQNAHFRLDFLPTKSVDGERRAVETSVPIARQPGLVPGLWRWQRRNGA